MYLSGISSYVPSSAIDNFVNGEKFGKTRDFIESKIGAYVLPRVGDGEDCFDLSIRSVERLILSHEIDITTIDLIVVITQNPSNHGIPHVSARLHGHFGFNADCHAFDISLGCSGYVYGLSVVASYMRFNDLRGAILVTSDPYSPILNSSDPSTNLLFGDASAATLITSYPTEFCYSIGKSSVFTNGNSWRSISKSDHNTLFMNGREVFNFALCNVPASVFDHLKRINLTIDDIDQFVFHQGSKSIVDSIVRKLGIPVSKVVVRASDVGNTISSSIPLALEPALKKKSHNVLLSGFGVGVSIANIVLTRPDCA